MALSTPEEAIQYALDTSGMYKGLCDHFVGLAYGQKNSGFESAKAHWSQTPEKYRHAGDTKAPIGSLVFFNGGQWGHVAIVTGKTASGESIITTTHTNGGKPTEMPLSQAMGLGYSGWAQPYFGGKVAKLDGVKLTSAVATVEEDPVAAAKTAAGGEGATASATGLVMDKLTKRELAESNSISWDFVKSHPEVMKVFDDAIKYGWNDNNSAVGKRNFLNALQKTSWFRDNSGYAREYLFKKSQGGEAWAEQVRTAEEFVRQTAQAVGATVPPEKLKFFADQTLMNGWNQPGRNSFLQQALTGQLSYKDDAGRTHVFQQDFIDYDAGLTAKNLQTLKNAAYKNGLTYSDDWYKAAVRSVQSGLGTLDDYLADIRKQAATSNPIFKDKIEAGTDLYDLASPYINRMSQILELDPNKINVNDPWIKKAMGGVDEKGNPIAMGLWDFEKALRQDERWQYTKQAHQEVGNLTQKIIAMFGFGG